MLQSDRARPQRQQICTHPAPALWGPKPWASAQVPCRGEATSQAPGYLSRGWGTPGGVLSLVQGSALVVQGGLGPGQVPGAGPCITGVLGVGLPGGAEHGLAACVVAPSLPGAGQVILLPGPGLRRPVAQGGLGGGWVGVVSMGARGQLCAGAAPQGGGLTHGQRGRSSICSAKNGGADRG